MAQNKRLQADIVVTADARGAREAAQETTGFAKAVNQLRIAHEKNIQTQRETVQTLAKLGEEGKELSAEWKLLHRDLDRLSTTMVKQEQQARDLAFASDNLLDTTREEQDAFNALDSEMKESISSQKILNDIIREGKDDLEAQGRAVDKQNAEFAELNNTLTDTLIKEKAKAQVDLELAKAQERATRSTLTFGHSMDELKQTLGQALAVGGVAGLAFKGLNLISDGFRRAIDAAKEFQRQATATFSDLQEEVARTKAQIPALTQTQEELYNTAASTAREIGRGAVETQTAIRKAMNLGLDYNEALVAVKQATDAARVGNTDMVQTLVTGMNAVNAYGVGVYELGEVLDIYANITNNSNLETSDLINGMAKIISPAAEAGVSLEEVGAAMIVMNRQGDDFGEIGDLLGNMLTQIAVKGTTAGQAFEDAAGVGFREFTAAGGTLIDGLKLLEQHAENTNQSISELIQGNSKFYRDMLAGRGVLELTGRHTAELGEAYQGTANAAGTLAEQTKEFEGTLYLANEQMIAAKEHAYAMEGSLTKGFAVGLVELKTDLYDLVAGLSQGIDAFTLFDAAFRDTARAGYGIPDVQQLAVKFVPEDSKNIDADYLRNAKLIVKLMEEQRDITFEQLEAELRRIYAIEAYDKAQEEILAKSKEQRDIVFELYEQRENQLATAVAISLADKTAAAEAEAAAAAEEKSAAFAERHLEIVQQIAEQALAYRMRLGEAYQASEGMIQTISDLQLELSVATDEESLDNLNQQLEEAGAAIDTHYRKNVINAMIASNGYTESVIDLAVELGLLTEDAGELQKQFVRVTDEGKKLAEMEGFKNLNFEDQAVAVQALADGIAATAKEAFNLVDPEAWRSEMPKGIVRAEDLMMIEPDVVIAQEDTDALQAMEDKLLALTEDEWETEISSNAEDVEEDIDELGKAIDWAVRGRELVITYKTVDESGDPVKPETDPLDPNKTFGATDTGSPNKQEINISIEQFFGATSGSPNDIKKATSEGLYEALQRWNLT
jgi:TP901 family phage tail tape measure protein